MPDSSARGARDDTVALLRDPYRFISRRAATLGTDAFDVRLLLRTTTCMTGAEAARVFYDPARFRRAGAAPGPLQKTLFGIGGVQGLDGEQHRHRKSLFLEVNRPDRVDALAELVRREWQAALPHWATGGAVELYPQVRRLLTVAVCAWAGVPLPDDDVETRTQQLSALFDQAGAVGPGHFRSRVARKHAEQWAAQVVTHIRADTDLPPGDSPAALVATHRDLSGHLLEPRVAAVELLNVLRPTVATAVYVVLVAHALHEHPQWRQRLADGDGSEDHAFVEEVRRQYPFFPAVTALVRERFTWHGHDFPEGRRVLLGLYGTNHDPLVWRDPLRFDPERFLGPAPDPFAFVPQGGGDPALHHRCPGEPISTRVMGVALDQLTRRMACTPVGAPASIDFRRLPALPDPPLRLRVAMPVGSV